MTSTLSADLRERVVAAGTSQHGAAEREDGFDAPDELDLESLVFLAETATVTNVARRYGRAPRGQRCQVAASQRHHKTTTVIACLQAGVPVAQVRAWRRRSERSA